MIDIYDKIIKNLNVILFYNETTILLRIDQNFYDSVSRLINISNNIEISEKLEAKQTKDYILLMESITEKKFVIEDFFNVDLVLATNELDNIKNIVKKLIKKDIEEISLILKKELIEDLEKKEAIESDNLKKENHQIKSNNKIPTNNENSASFEQRNASSIHQIANTMIEQQAQALVFMDIRNGKLYRYTSKPKSIPIVKNVLLVLVALLAIILLVTNIVALTFSSPTGNVLQVFAYGPLNADIQNWLVLNSRGWFYNILPFFGVFSIAFSVFSFSKNVKTNDNVKYSMRILTYVLPMIVFVVFTFFSLSGNVVLNWSKIINNGALSTESAIIKNWTYTSINETSFDRLLIIFVFTIIGYVVCGLIFLLIVVSSNYKPKEDYEKLSTIRQGYVNDIKSGKIDLTDPSMQPPRRRFPF